MYRILNNHAPTYLCDKFSYKKHCYNTRQSELHLDVIRSRSDSGKRTFRFRGAQVWNSLSENLQSSKNIESFKKKLKSTRNDQYFTHTNLHTNTPHSRISSSVYEPFKGLCLAERVQ